MANFGRVLAGIATGGLSELFRGSSNTGASASDDFGLHLWDNSNNKLKGFWETITGQKNTNLQNSAAASLQEDAQKFNSAESAEQRQWESDEAQKNRDWQTWMSNTAVQRSAEDYVAAGFNPLLAVGNGAGTGSPVMSSGSSASSPVASTQASNVNMLASIGTAAAGIGILLKALKAFAK